MQTQIDDAKSKADDFDVRLFRRCVGQFATGVTVITAQVGEDRAGVTANSFSSLSLDPPLVLWSIARTSRSFEAFAGAKHFAINVLGANQLSVSQAFSSKSTDKFEGIRWTPGVTGAPVLHGTVATIECRTESRFDGGDHVIIVGHVENFERFDGDPLLFIQGRYGVAVDHPEVPMSLHGTSGSTSPHADACDIESQLLFRLLFQTFYCMSESFEEQRNAEGMNLILLRVLIGSYEQPGIKVEKLSRFMHITVPDAEDAVEELVERGELGREEDGGLRLTEKGRQRREAIARRENEFERKQLAGMPEGDIAAARRLLTRLIKRNGGDA